MRNMFYFCLQFWYLLLFIQILKYCFNDILLIPFKNTSVSVVFEINNKMLRLLLLLMILQSSVEFEQFVERVKKDGGIVDVVRRVWPKGKVYTKRCSVNETALLANNLLECVQSRNVEKLDDGCTLLPRYLNIIWRGTAAMSLTCQKDAVKVREANGDWGEATIASCLKFRDNTLQYVCPDIASAGQLFKIGFTCTFKDIPVISHKCVMFTIEGKVFTDKRNTTSINIKPSSSTSTQQSSAFINTLSRTSHRDDLHTEFLTSPSSWVNNLVTFFSNTTPTANILPSLRTVLPRTSAVNATRFQPSVRTAKPLKPGNEDRNSLLYAVFVGAVVLLILAGCLVCLFCWSKRRSNKKSFTAQLLASPNDEDDVFSEKIVLEELYTRPTKKRKKWKRKKTRDDGCVRVPSVVWDDYDEVGGVIPDPYPYSYAQVKSAELSVADPYVTIVGRNNSFSPRRRPPVLKVTRRQSVEDNSDYEDLNTDRKASVEDFSDGVGDVENTDVISDNVNISDNCDVANLLNDVKNTENSGEKNDKSQISNNCDVANLLNDVKNTENSGEKNDKSQISNNCDVANLLNDVKNTENSGEKNDKSQISDNCDVANLLDDFKNIENSSEKNDKSHNGVEVTNTIGDEMRRKTSSLRVKQHHTKLKDGLRAQVHEDIQITPRLAKRNSVKQSPPIPVRTTPIAKPKVVPDGNPLKPKRISELGHKGYVNYNSLENNQNKDTGYEKIWSNKNEVVKK